MLVAEFVINGARPGPFFCTHIQADTSLSGHDIKWPEIAGIFQFYNKHEATSLSSTRDPIHFAVVLAISFFIDPSQRRWESIGSQNLMLRD